MDTAQHNTIWNQRVTALDAFVDREGHALVPAKHVETLNGGTIIGLGAWVSYVRTRYRNDSLSPARITKMESYSGWQWGPLKPGPKPDSKRDEEIQTMRNNGKSLQNIGDAYGLSRQRIHQIVSS